AAPRRRPQPVLSRPGARGAGALARARRLSRVAAPPAGRRAVGVLRGPADRERAPRLPPRPRARLQGHLPALQDDARPPGRAQGRLGLPRAARGDRGGARARDQPQGGDRGLRDRRVQRPLPRVGLHLPGGLEPADGADRLLARPRRRLPDARPVVHRVRLVGAEADRRQGPALRGPQGRAVLPPLRHRAELARGRPGLPRRCGPLRVRALPRARRPRRGAGGRRAARVDHDAVDARLQRGGRRRRRPALRPRDGSRLPRADDPRRGARGARPGHGGRHRPGRLPRARARGDGLRAPVRVHPRERVRREGPHRPARRLRHRRRRHGPGPHGDRLRRGRLPPGPAGRPGRGQPRPPRRHVRRAHHGLCGPGGQGRRPRPDRGPRGPRPRPARAGLRACLPALLALRDPAALLRQAELVHRDLAPARP
ncbi:MAG: Isoleucyl-tRNA synthetase, partial [uncultured Solirubrobacteraceae bacterium]